MKKIVVMLVVLGAVGYGLLSFHFILLDNNIKIIKKTHPRYENTFVDARGAKKLELLTKPDLIEAGINNIFHEVDSAVKQQSK